MKRLSAVLAVLLVLVMTACQPEAPAELPTLAVIDTASPSPTIEATAELTATETAVEETPEVTEESTPTETATPLPSETPSSTPLPIVTPIRTLPPATPNAAASATAAAQEAPRFSTLTPAPTSQPGQPTPEPQIVADVIVTEVQFQEEVTRLLPEYPTVREAVVDFTPDGVVVYLTASGGEALITGTMLVTITISEGVAFIQIASITTNAPEPPPLYVQAASDCYTMLIEVLDTILQQRLGERQDLENVVLTADAMLITLLVPLEVATNAP